MINVEALSMLFRVSQCLMLLACNFVCPKPVLMQIFATLSVTILFYLKFKRLPLSGHSVCSKIDRVSIDGYGMQMVNLWLWCSFSTYFALFVRYRVYTTKSFIFWQEDFEDTKGVIRISKSKDRQHNDQKNKQQYTKHYT